MNEEYFDKLLSSKMDEVKDLSIEKSFIEFCVHKFSSYETALKYIMSEKKVQNRHRKLGNLSYDEKLESIKNFNIYKVEEKEFEDYIYSLLSIRLEDKISYFIFYYIYYGKLYK